MQVKTQIFAVPTSAGVADFNIAGWTETPVAAKFVLIGTDGTDSFDDDSVLSTGFTDGTSDWAIGAWSQNGLTESLTYRIGVNNSVVSHAGGDNIDAAFSQWNTGGVELTWSGAGLSGNTCQVLVTFFAGADVSAEVFKASPGDHVESLSFTSKLIFSATSATVHPFARNYQAFAVAGVCTNGTNGLTQQFAHYWPGDYFTTTDLTQAISVGYISGEYWSGTVWETTISSVDSVGFNLSDSNADEVIFLALDFDDDVDSGTATVPISGDINVTDPGFTPQFIGVIGTSNTALNTVDSTSSYQGIYIGETDGTRENSVSIAGDDNVGTTNEVSVHSSNIIHFENASQSDQFDASFDTFDSSGFDLTVNTNPSTATYFIWWAIEEEDTGNDEITGTANASSSVTGALTGRAQISGGTGLGTDLKDAEEINDDANWIAYETAVITQNGSYVNIVAGTHSWGGYVNLSASVLISALTDGQEYSLRCVVQSENGAFNIRVRDTSGDMGSYSVSDGEIARIDLGVIKNSGLTPYLTFENMGSGEEANVYVYTVASTVGSAVTGSIKAKGLLSGTVNGSSMVTGQLIEKQNDPITGTVNGSSTVTGSIKAKGVLSGTINTLSTTSGKLVATVPITGTVTTASAVLGDLSGRGSISGTINASSTVTGNVGYRAKITQNGQWVNIIGGTDPTAAYIDLDSVVLSPILTDGKYFVVRGVAWSESGAVNITLNDFGAGDSVSISSGEIKRFQLVGIKSTGNTPYLSFSSFGPSDELNIFIHQVNEVVGSIVTGDIYGIEGNWMFGTINASSIVTGSIIAYGSISGSANGISTVSADIVAKGSIAGTINTSSSVSAKHIAYAKISGTINASSSVTGFLELGKIFGTINTFSTVSGDIRAKGVLSGTISASSSTQGVVYGRGVLSGTITASSAVSALLSAYVPISGTTNGSSSVSGNLIDGATLSVTINGSSTVTGAIVGRTELSTSVNTGSIVSGRVRAVVPITGTINAGSTVSADLHWKTETKYITGSFNGSSSVSAFHNARARLVGTINSSSTVSGFMRGRAYLSGTSNGSSTVTGHVQVTQYISGTINGSSVVTGKIRSLSVLSGVIISSSEVSGALIHKPNYKQITGTINAGSTVAGSMISYALALGTINGSSTVSAAIRRNIPISGTVNTSSVVSANITAKVRSNISGSTSGSTVASAKIIGRVHASGAIYTASIVTGEIKASIRITGTINGSSEVTAKIRAVFAISGSIFAASTVSGVVHSKPHSKEITGTINAGSIVSGAIHGRGQLQGAINTESNVEGHLSGRGLISGTINGISTLAGAVRAVVPISGVVTTSSSVTANLSIKTHKKEISGSTAGYSIVTGQLTPTTQISGTIETGSTITGRLVGRTSISGTVASNTSVSGILKGMVYGSVTILSTSQITADLHGIGLLGGSTVSRSMVLGILRAKGVPFSELIEGFVLEDVIKASIFEQTFEGRVREAEYKMVAMDPNMKLTIDEPDLKFKVMEDTLDGIMENDETTAIIE